MFGVDGCFIVCVFLISKLSFAVNSHEFLGSSQDIFFSNFARTSL